MTRRYHPDRLDSAIAHYREIAAERLFSCGNCGARFATKGEKRRHKLACNASPAPATVADCGENDDEFLYARVRNSPEIVARAAAEWEAMDEAGRLPAGWTYEGHAHA